MVARSPEGGNRFSPGDQESVGRNAKGGVMVEAAPSPSFKMSQPDLLLEFLIVPLNAPAQLGKIDKPAEADLCRQRREPVLGRLCLSLRPKREDSQWVEPSRHLTVRQAPWADNSAIMDSAFL